MFAGYLPPSPFPGRGPSLWTIRGFQQVSIASGASLGPPGSDASVKSSLCLWYFPRDVFVTGVQLTPASATPDVDLAGLSLRIQDESFTDVILTGSQVQNSADGAALFRQPDVAGLGLNGGHPFALQRPVKSHDQWLFTVTNNSTGAIVLASLCIYFAEARGGRYGAGVNA